MRIFTRTCPMDEGKDIKDGDQDDGEGGTN